MIQKLLLSLLLLTTVTAFGDSNYYSKICTGIISSDIIPPLDSNDEGSRFRKRWAAGLDKFFKDNCSGLNKSNLKSFLTRARQNCVSHCETSLAPKNSSDARIYEAGGQCSAFCDQTRMNITYKLIENGESACLTNNIDASVKATDKTETH